MITDSAMADELRRLFLFSAFTDEEMAQVLRQAARVQAQAGETLFVQGERTERFFWLRRGLVKLTRLSPDGEEKVVELIREGQTFGEAIVFMERQLYPVNAEAIEPCELVGFDCHGFRQLLRGSVDTCFRLLAALSMRLHQQIDEIDRLTLHTATTRLVAYLLEQRQDGERIQLDMPKHLLASRLSIQPETLSRIFARLGKSGLISVEGQAIRVLDRDGLRAQAGLQ